METSTSNSMEIEKEHKADDDDDDVCCSDGVVDVEEIVRNGLGTAKGSALPTEKQQRPNNKRLNLVQMLIGRCSGLDCTMEGRTSSMCATFPAAAAECRGMGLSSTQFVELQGLRFIGLGALADELSPKDRVHDTVEQLATRTERLIFIGYLVDPTFDKSEELLAESSTRVCQKTETVPLDVWNNNNSEINHGMSKQVQTIVELTTTKQFKKLQEEFTRQLRTQKGYPNRGNNKYFSGITAHNLGVLAVLRGKPDEAIAYFREAICLKESAFGRKDREVALSWDELGIQFFARGDFEGALTSFREAHAVRNVKNDGSASSHPSVAMVLNNMACCYFQMGDHLKALETLQDADEIQQKAVSSSAQADLDLLHVAIVICNCGYLKLALKKYEEARSLFEEALLIQQSVLDDNHRAVRDTLSNIEFANAFHS